MRRVIFGLLIVTLLCLPTQVYASWSVISGTSNFATVGPEYPVTTGAINTTNANLIIVALQQTCYLDSNVVDSASNSWTMAGTTCYDGMVFKGRVTIWYTYSPTTSSSHTFTGTSSNGCMTNPCYASISVLALSGAEPGASVQYSAGTSTSSTMVSSGSITPPDNGRLIFATSFGNNYTSVGTSVDSGMSILHEVQGIASQAAANVTATLIQTSAAAINATFTYMGSGNNNNAAIASFKVNAADSNPSGSHLFRIMGVGQ